MNVPNSVSAHYLMNWGLMLDVADPESLRYHDTSEVKRDLTFEDYQTQRNSGVTPTNTDGN